MSGPFSILHVNIEYSTEDDELGPVFVASFQEIAATTDGETIDEVLRDIREVVDLYQETQNETCQSRLAEDVRIIITMELPKCAAIA